MCLMRRIAPVTMIVFLTSCALCQQRATAVLAKPTPEQVAWHDMEVEMFLCLDPCTWQDKEYDDHSTPLSKINPTKLDTDQWARVAEAMGARQIVFVAKHVGGFAWWQTDTTDYGIRNTPWRDGKGDVVADLAASCRKHGLKLGIYLSPADNRFGAGAGGRCKTKEAQERYSQVYRQQLTELLTRYGEVAEVWFDGSTVIEVGDILKKHAPKAMVFQGPHATIRWVGNENGVAPYPAWNAVSEADARSGVATARHGSPRGTAWLPLECDARIRSTWFWNTKNAHTLKSVEQLMNMYYRSVGHGAVLLLNNTPDTTGLIPEADARRSAEFGAEIRRRLGRPLAETTGKGQMVELTLRQPSFIDHVVTMEDIREGERVREYVVEALVGGTWRTLCTGTAIGHKRIDRVNAVKASKVRLRVTRSVGEPIIRKLAVHDTNPEDPQVAEKLAKPTPEQVAWHDCEIGMFIHFAPNTWLNKQGDDLSLPLEKFNPSKLDTDQWAAAAEAMGAGYIVFVAKHVGGFCMWQTDTTDYGVASTPWRGGKGDVLADLAASCRRRGIKLGVYLSPCDRKHGAGVGGRCGTPEAQERYNAMYRQQLTEVLTRYGEIFEVWFDGSNVVPVGDILKKHAPGAMVFQGPNATIRWVGNEGGVAPYPAWNSLSEADAKSGVATARHGNPVGTAWLPNECDARIRADWFWTTTNAPSLKSVDELMGMYYRSVGHGAVLLLNHTPDTTGLIPEADVQRGAEFGAEIRRRFGKPVAETEGRGNTVELTLPAPTAIDHAVIMEDIRYGERVREYVVEGWAAGRWQPLCQGTAIGHKKIDQFAPVEVSKIRLRCTRAATTPRIRRLAAYAVFATAEPLEPPSQTPVGRWTFDEVRDGKVLDSSGKGRHGVVKGAELADGRRGKALRLNGRDSYVSLGRLPVFRGDFTIAAWVSPKAGATGLRIIAAKETCGVGANQCRFYLTGGHRVGFMMSDAYGTHIWPFEPGAAVPADRWSHVAVTRRQATFTLYVNGKAIGAKTSPAAIRHHNNVELKIGANFDVSGKPVQVFNGLIDEVSLYNRALAPEEIAALAALADAPARNVPWAWKPGQLKADWMTVDINITPFCKEATQYDVAFRKTGGRDDIEVKALTIFFDDRETPEWVQRAKEPNTFIATLPGVGVPLRLRAVLRGKGGSDTAGRLVIHKRPH